MSKTDENGNWVAELPDVSHGGINDSAWLIWQSVHETASFKKHAMPSRHKGFDGFLWQGTVNSLVETLWPDLTERHLISQEDADEIKKTLNTFLRQSNNLICKIRNGPRTPATWWISAEWSPLILTKVGESPFEQSKDEGGAAEEVFDTQREMTKNPQSQINRGGESSIYPCRWPDGCNEVYTRIPHRGTHEMKIHGFRVNEDGSHTFFDPSGRRPTTEEVMDLALQLASGTLLTQEDLVEAMRKVNPLISKMQGGHVVKALEEESHQNKKLMKTQIKDEQTGSSLSRYTVSSVPATPKKGGKIVEETDESPVRRRAIRVTPGTAMTPREAAQAVPADEVDVKHLATVKELLDGLESLTELAKRLPQGGVPQDTHNQTLRELASARAEVARLESTLAEVTGERDEFKRQLNVLKQAFAVLGN